MGLLVLANGSGEGKPSWLWAAGVKLVTKSSLSVCTERLPLGLTDGKINQLPSLTELGDHTGSGGTESLYPCGAVGFLDVLLRGHHRWSPGPRSWGDPLATCETILLQCKRGGHAKETRATGGPCIRSKKSRTGAMIMRKGKSLHVPAHCEVNTMQVAAHQ